MGRLQRKTNTRVSTPILCKELFKNKPKSKQMKTKVNYKVKYIRKKFLIRNNKNNKNFIIEELEKLTVNKEHKITYKNDNIKNNILDNYFKEEVFRKLDFLDIEQNIEDIKM